MSVALSDSNADPLAVFAKTCHDILSAEPGAAGRKKVADALQGLLTDPDFHRIHMGAENDSPRHLLYKDDELKFCIFSHAYTGAKSSEPHDHGPSWAIYGQASGETEMTDWEIVEATKPGEKRGKVKAAKVYKLKPGDAYLYNEGDVHSPSREGDTRLIRIEGINMDGVPRCWYEAI